MILGCYLKKWDRMGIKGLGCESNVKIGLRWGKDEAFGEDGEFLGELLGTASCEAGRCR